MAENYYLELIAINYKITSINNKYLQENYTIKIDLT